mgnify:FL=1
MRQARYKSAVECAVYRVDICSMHSRVVRLYLYRGSSASAAFVPRQAHPESPTPLCKFMPNDSGSSTNSPLPTNTSAAPSLYSKPSNTVPYNHVSTDEAGNEQSCDSILRGWSLNELYVDGLKFSIDGGIPDEGVQLAASLSKLLDELSGKPSTQWQGPDSVRYTASRGSMPYRLHLRSPHGTRLYTMPGFTSLPALRIRFPAAWCRITPPLVLGNNAMEVARNLGYRAVAATPSRVDLAVDLSTSVASLTSGKHTGTCLRGGGSICYYTKDKNKQDVRPLDAQLATVCNHTGGRKHQTFTVYDKRLKEAGSNSPYEAVWEETGIGERPVTRVELQMRRPRLKKQQIHTAAALNQSKIEETWTWFHTYSRFESPGAHPWESVRNATVAPYLSQRHGTARFGALRCNLESGELINGETGEVLIEGKE